MGTRQCSRGSRSTRGRSWDLWSWGCMCGYGGSLQWHTELCNTSITWEPDNLSNSAYMVGIESPTNVPVDLYLMSQGRICETNKIFLYVKNQVLIVDMHSNSMHFNVEATYLNISPNDLEWCIESCMAHWCGPWVMLNVLSGIMQKVEFQYKHIFHNVFPLEGLMLQSKSLCSYVVSVKHCANSNGLLQKGFSNVLAKCIT